MNIKTISISSERDHPNLLKLLAATKQGGFDHEVINSYVTFYTAFDILKKWCEENKNNYTYFIYTDGWDAMCLGTQEEFISKLPVNIKCLVETEKGCFPNGDLTIKYPETKFKWRFVNAGQFFCEIEYFLYLCEKYPLEGMNQLWLSEVFLRERGYLFQLDYDCQCFQSIAFEEPDEYATTRDGRLINRKTGSFPVWVHDNGGGKNLDWIYDLKRSS